MKKYNYKKRKFWLSYSTEATEVFSLFFNSDNSLVSMPNSSSLKALGFSQPSFKHEKIINGNILSSNFGDGNFCYKAGWEIDLILWFSAF